ncbi:MAG: hypothetical protein GXP27_00525, partial [Planctomycetes bacterium]|nr:hypothetical protein [Planctomycetota bacterium]
AVVLLTRAASEQDLIEALEVWQQVDGRKATPVTYADQKYHRWSKPGEGGDQEVQFYWTQGRTLCLSNSEKALRKTIDFASRSGPGSPGKKSLAESTPFRAAVSELAANVVAVAYLNPRAWDSQVERSADNRMFVELWHRCQSVVLSVALDPGIRVTENVRWRPTTAEVPAQPHGDGEPLAVARCLAGVPPEALLVACGKLRVAPDWIDRFVELIPPNDRREIAGLRRVLRGLLLGFDLFSDVLPECQGNWSAFVVASDQKQSNRLPIDAAIRIPVPRDKRLSSDSSGTTVYNALDNALSAGANLLGAVRNAESTGPLVVLRQKGEGLDRVRWLDGLGICEPAYGWTDSALYLATSPAVIRSWMDRAKSGQPAGEVLRMSRSLPRDVDQAVLLNVRRVRSVLRDRQSFLVQHLSARNPSKRQRVAGDLEAIADMLRLLDFVYLTIRSSEESFEITFGGDLF